MNEEITDPSALLAAADAGAPMMQLDDVIERLVRRALTQRTWGLLTAASRALRLEVRCLREDRQPVPARVALLLGEVRAAMAERGGRST